MLSRVTHCENAAQCAIACLGPYCIVTPYSLSGDASGGTFSEGLKGKSQICVELKPQFP